MSTTLFVEQENGNLKLIAEVEGIDNPALAVDALLDDAPRLKEREFVAIVGEDGVGTVCRVTVDSDEPVNPKRSMTVLGGDDGEEVAEQPVPKPTRRKPAARKAAPAKRKTPARKAPAKKPATKPAAKKAAPKPRKPAAKKPAAKKAGGKSPFNRNTKGDD